MEGISYWEEFFICNLVLEVHFNGTKIIKYTRDCCGYILSKSSFLKGYLKTNTKTNTKPKTRSKPIPARPKLQQTQYCPHQNHIKTNTVHIKTISKPILSTSKPYQNQYSNTKTIPKPKLQSQNFKTSIGFGACLSKTLKGNMTVY